MKKKSILLFVSIIAFVSFLFPFVVKAEENNEEQPVETKEKVKVYLFKKEGCQYCNGALEFFTKLAEDKEYGSYFELVKYDIINEEESANLFDDVIDYLGGEIDGQEISGVPLILIGSETFPGYDLEGGWDDQLKDAIKTEYEKDVANRVDLIEKTIESNKTSPIVGVVVCAVIVGAIVLVFVARNKNKKNN